MPPAPGRARREGRGQRLGRARGEATVGGICEHTFVRWSNLTIDEEQRHRLPGYAEEAVVRHFDAPEALDTRFYEVRARSILNRVPKQSRMPFRWTINPYRGCSHACSYCVGGETGVLMADGRIKRMAELQVGEAIYGTNGDGSDRRYLRTAVLNKWAVEKLAYRVTLADGTRLIASGDHRLLTNRGWRHVVNTPAGRRDRAHLKEDNHLVGTGAFEPGTSIEGQVVTASEDLRITKVEPLERMQLYDITTGTGDFIADGVVSHNCFARPTHRYLDFDAGRDFEREIVVKVNAPELLRAELARRSWGHEHVAMGTNTDPYQWVEGRYKLMEGIWEALRDAANPCSVLTKSPLLLRDLGVMREIAERTEISACLSIPTLDEKAWRATEPHTPNPRARLEAVLELNRAGIPTGVLVAPLMPGINDAPEQLEPLLTGAAEAGATSVSGIALHLRGEVRELFMGWLRENRPGLVARYEELYRNGAYARREERERLAGLVRERGAHRGIGNGAGASRNEGDSRAGTRRRFARDRDVGTQVERMQAAEKAVGRPGRSGAEAEAGQPRLF
jgi:DNA repair photolyase